MKVWTWENATPREILEDMLEGTGWYVGKVEINSRRNLSLEEGLVNRLKAMNELPSIFDGELKFNTIMVRLGGAYYGNPYKEDKANRIKLGGGLGYRNKGFFVDLTYVYAINKDVNYPYRLQDKPDDPASIRNNAGNIVATIGFKL